MTRILAALTLLSAVWATAPPAAAQKLRWAPPRLDRPVVIDLKRRGDDNLILDDRRDYVLRYPRRTKVGATFVRGGHDVVVIGGSVRVAKRGSFPTALRFDGQTGTIHVEGIVIQGKGGIDSDGIDFNAPRARAQVQNVRVERLQGRKAGIHADVMQPWGGIRRLRVYKLSGTSTYQGLYLPVEQGPIGRIELRKVDLGYDADGPGDGGQLLWLAAGCEGVPTIMREVYLGPLNPAFKSIGNAAWPKTDFRPCSSRIRGDRLSFPTLPVRGFARLRRPPGGSFVPAGSVGARYRTPGYRSRRATARPRR